MLFRKSYFFIVFIFNLILVSFHFVKNLNFSGTTKILGLDPYSFLRDLFKSLETQPRTLAWKELPQFKEPVLH
ncbi:hypothetical protein LEP1GSC049_0355 [Leptospira kirschneri serovar Cynopteri str. 3522 CT]|nr:hypothetical protein LEP1GSC049_0355 [Leptospira kirschneri serovar Cynopteri str. 3522 CT]